MLIAVASWPNGHENSERVECDGIIARTYHDMCRKLVAANYPDQGITFYRDGKPCFVFGSIHKAAKFTVTEDDRGIHIRKYRPFPAAGVGQERRSRK